MCSIQLIPQPQQPELLCMLAEDIIACTFCIYIGGTRVSWSVLSPPRHRKHAVRCVFTLNGLLPDVCAMFTSALSATSTQFSKLYAYYFGLPCAANSAHIATIQEMLAQFDCRTYMVSDDAFADACAIIRPRISLYAPVTIVISRKHPGGYQVTPAATVNMRRSLTRLLREDNPTNVA